MAMTGFTDEIIANTIDYMVSAADDAPSLTALAERAGYEPAYFQKLFSRHVGISPKRMSQYMQMRKVGELLSGGSKTLDAAYEAGLSGNGRLHDLCVSVAGVTPGDIQSRGKGLTIRYGYYPTVIGEILVGQTDKGVCWLGFVMGDDRQAPLTRIYQHWPQAEVVEDQKACEKYARALMEIWTGATNQQGMPLAQRLPVDLHGTNFQIQVWQALLKIPRGMTTTYQSIGTSLGRPKASRAIGNAVGANPISVLIPCHRVIRATGIIDNYAWGSARKKIILGLENNAPD